MWTLLCPSKLTRFQSETSAGLAITGNAKGISSASSTSSARSTTTVPGWSTPSFWHRRVKFCFSVAATKVSRET